MPAYFGSGAQVDINTVRSALNQGSGDVRYLASLCGFGTPDYFSDWWNVNFFSYVYIRQGEGYIWDGCSGKDTWSWLEGTTEYGGYLGAFGGGSTYNTERGYNNGTFLTFGYGYNESTLRPYTEYMIGIGSSGSNCILFRHRLSQDGVAGFILNQPISNSSDENRNYFTAGFQTYRYYTSALVAPSDRKIKENLVKVCKIGEINFYRFNYIWDKKTIHFGVIAQELIGTEFQSFVEYDFMKDIFMVDYGKIIEYIQQNLKK